MNKFSREITIEILVGLFMFTVLIALSVFTIVLSREKLFSKTHSYEFVFSEVNGLREGDNVYLRGMNIGRVKQTMLENSHVHVYVTLEHEIELRHGYNIEVVDASMLGGKYLKIYEGPEEAPLLGDNVTILGTQPLDMIKELSKAIQGLQGMIDSVEQGEGTLGKLLGDEEIYNNLAAVSEDLKAVMAGVRAGEGTVGKLLSDDTVYDDAAVVLAGLRTVAEGLENGEGTFGKLLNDETVYDDAAATMASLRKVSEGLENGESTLGKLMSEDAAFYGDLTAAMASIREISERINSGEGTLGRLVADSKLYDEAAMLVEDVRAAVDDLREASPITSFGSVLFGAF